MSEKKWWSWKREEEEDAGEGSLEWSERSERNGSEPSPATPIAAGGAADAPATEPATAFDGVGPAGVPTPVPVMPDAAAAEPAGAPSPPAQVAAPVVVEPAYVPAASDIAETPGQPPEDAQQPGRFPESAGLAPEDDAATRTDEPRQAPAQSRAGTEEFTDAELPREDVPETDELAGDEPDDGPDDGPDNGLSLDMGPVDGRPAPLPPNLTARRRGTLAKQPPRPTPLSPEQKLLLLDTWQRSGLPARDFGAMVNVSRHTLYAWKKRFDELGPAGLMDKPRGSKPGSRLPDLTKRTILMLKTAHPEWGCQRIGDMLTRGPALPASPGAIARVLHEAGYTMEEHPTRPHPQPVRSFERATPNQLWQTDLFTFMLKRQNRRVYLVAFMDDHSRFITGYGLHASQSAALVLEVLRAAIAGYGVPEEILTDNGSQYITWRGKSQFTRELEKRGIRQIVARPRRPQTLGKIERFWGSLWRECVEAAVFLDLAEARQRIGLWIDYYNLQRPHQGIGGLVPADRFFHAAPEVLKTLQQRVAENARELARHGVPKRPFYLTGQVEGRPFSVHREGDRVILRQADAAREEIELAAPHDDPARGDGQLAVEAHGNGAPAQPAASEQAADALPAPMCPDGSPSSRWAPSAPLWAAGTSALDGFAMNREAEPPREEVEEAEDSPPRASDVVPTNGPSSDAPPADASADASAEEGGAQ